MFSVIRIHFYRSTLACKPRKIWHVWYSPSGLIRQQQYASSRPQSKEVYRNGTITLSWTPHSVLTLISLVHGAPDARFSPQHCRCASSTCKERHRKWTNLFGIASMITTPPRKYLCFATRASIHSCTSLGKDLGAFVAPTLWTTYALQTHG